MGSKKENYKIPIGWWVVLGIVILLFCFTITGIIFSSNKNSNNSVLSNATLTNQEFQYSQEDCPKSNTDCNGTTRIVHNYKLINNDCIEEPLIEYNSFSCGYKVPCDPIECKNKSTTTCEDTTKNITEYKCDDGVGCYAEVVLIKNSTDCGYIETFSGKYTLADVNKVKQLAKSCKFDIEGCLEDYKFDKIYVGKSTIGIINPDTGEETYSKIYLEGYIFTPFAIAVNFASNKEKNYETYTDGEIKSLLDTNKIGVFFEIPASDSYQIFGYYGREGILGTFSTLVIKYNNKIYPSEQINSSFSIYNRQIDGYNELYDKEIELVIVGDKKEISKIIDLNKYK
jgi:hypothetical protein